MKALEKFADKYGFVVEYHGEIGFGRKCVGFLHGTSYVEYDAHYHNDDWFGDEDLVVPDGIAEYNKGSYLVVRVENDDYELALGDLAKWAGMIEDQGIYVDYYPAPRNSVSYMMGDTDIAAVRVVK